MNKTHIVERRKTPIDMIKCLWSSIRQSSSPEIEHSKLLKNFQKNANLSIEDAEKYISYAEKDGLIAASIHSKKQKPKSAPLKSYSLPDVENYKMSEDQPDWYCYECHQQGQVTKCEGCIRVFHKTCVQSDVDKQKQLDLFHTKNKRINISSFNINNENNSTPKRKNMKSPASVTNTSSTKEPIKRESLSECKILLTDVKLEDQKCFEKFVNTDPEYMGILRGPDQRLVERLNAPSVKPEESTNDAVECSDIQKFCYACRQAKLIDMTTPPNMSKEELNYLLSFMVNEYRSWLPHDTYSNTKLFGNMAKVPEIIDNMSLCKGMLLRSPKTFKEVIQSIKNNEYERLGDFFSDTLDIVHNIAIIHGVNSLEYNAGMYLLNDCVYDLSEVRQCRDCYRHSNEKADPNWFTRPCVPRHELVYAKQKGYQHWPAKVIRVLNNKYDVRFFGDKHARALIEASSVKPIDSSYKLLKIDPKKRGFQTAVDELHKHQQLIDLPPGMFSFKNGTTTTNDEILRNENTSTPTSNGSASRTNMKSPELVDTNTSTESHNLNEKRASKRIADNYSSVPINKKLRPSEVPLQSSEATSSPNDNTKSSNISSNHTSESQKPRSPRIKSNLKRPYSDDVENLKLMLSKMNDLNQVKALALNALQADIDRWQMKMRTINAEFTNQISEVKKKQWCKNCEHESILHCCWNTTYCSRLCQEKNWPLHKKDHQYANK